jgi:hypothetical protein
MFTEATMSAVLESETRYPGLPVPQYVPGIFTKLGSMTPTEAFFTGGYRRARDLRVLQARYESDPDVRKSLIRAARKDNRELVRWLRMAR